MRHVLFPVDDVKFAIDWRCKSISESSYCELRSEMVTGRLGLCAETRTSSSWTLVKRKSVFCGWT